jgi:hypothetical protein
MSLGRGQMDASFGENVTLLARKMQLASSFIMSIILILDIGGPLESKLFFTLAITSSLACDN